MREDVGVYKLPFFVVGDIYLHLALVYRHHRILSLLLSRVVVVGECGVVVSVVVVVLLLYLVLE